MSPWFAALIAVLPPFAVASLLAVRGGAAERLVAIQLASAIATLALVLMSYAFDQPSFLDLSFSLVLLSMPGTLVFAHFLERWL